MLDHPWDGRLELSIARGQIQYPGQNAFLCLYTSAMKLSSQFIPVDGVKLHVADWGGSGPDLLLLHANGFLG